jgi:putative hydrolase of the HAD superfamily
MIKSNMNTIDIILFDLGGVLVELTGVPTMIKWTKNIFNESEMWEAWLRSPSVRSFEKGDTSATQFAADIINEMNLPVGIAEFIDNFTHWPSGLFPGVPDLLKRLSHRTLACFSNSNELHWPRLMKEMGLEKMLNYHFASHEMGKLKPDKEAFAHVLNSLGCHPSSVLFFDDNELNVKSAREMGLMAYQAKGPQEVEDILVDMKILKNQN